MSTNQDYPLLNGYAPSWADIQTTIDVQGGSTVIDIDYKALNFSSQVEFGEQRGASGGRVMKQTTGSEKLSASGTYYRSGMRTLQRALMAVAPVRGNQVRVSLVRFNIRIQHSWDWDPSEIYVDILRGCRMLKKDFKMAEGNDADVVETDFGPLQIIEIIDGKEIVLV